MGRKTGYSLFMELPSNWRETVANKFAEGWSDIEVHLEIGVSANDHETLLKNEDYYLEFKNGMAISEAYWHRWARDNVGSASRDINTKLFNDMMNRFFRWDQREAKAKEKDDGKGKKKDAQAFGKKFNLVKTS